MKKKRGRKTKERSDRAVRRPGVYTGTQPGHEESSDISNRIICGHPEWQIVRLRKLIVALKNEQATAQRNMLLEEQEAYREEIKGRRDKITRKKLTPAQVRDRQRTVAGLDEALQQIDDTLAALERGDERAWPLADNFLSSRARETQPDEMRLLWRELVAQFERAVLRGNTDWFERQAAGILWNDRRTESEKTLARFKAEVVRRLDQAIWLTRAKQRAKQMKNEERWKEARKKQQIEWEQYRDSPEGRTASPRERQVKFASLVQEAKPHIESDTLTPAGKTIDARARQILESFHLCKDAKPLTFTPELKREIRELEQMNKKAMVEDIIGQPYERDENREPVPVSEEGGALIVEWKEGARKFAHRFKNERCALDAVRGMIGLLQLHVADGKSVET